MNIPDKPALCAGVRRVLRPGGIFAIYDVMRLADGDLAFPLPWAAGPATSFVATSAEYRTALAAAGFTIQAEHTRAAFALESLRAMQARVAAEGRPALGLHILMGENARQKTGNLVQNLERGLVAPMEIIARAVVRQAALEEGAVAPPLARHGRPSPTMTRRGEASCRR